MIFNVAVNPQGTSGIKNRMNNNPTPTIPEDARSGKTNICKKSKIMNSDGKYAFVYMSKIESSRITNS